MPKKFSYFIAFRYLRVRKQGFISLINFISFAGIAIGVMSLIVVISVMNGFHQDIRDKIIGTNAHVIASSYFKDGISNYAEKVNQISKIKYVIGIAPYFMGQVMLKSQDKVEGILLWGIIPESISKVNNLNKNIIKGDIEFINKELPDGKKGILLGKELVNRLGVDLGDDIIFNFACFFSRRQQD